MNSEKKQKFLKWYKTFQPWLSSKKKEFHGPDIEEIENGYTIRVYEFENLMEILNYLGQMAAQFSIGYCYEDDPKDVIEYQIDVIDFDEDFLQRSTEYI